MCGQVPRVQHIQRSFPVALTFSKSPLSPLDDLPFGNLPVLILRRPQAQFERLMAALRGHFDGLTAVVSEAPSAAFELPYSVQVNRAFE